MDDAPVNPPDLPHVEQVTFTDHNNAAPVRGRVQLNEPISKPNPDAKGSSASAYYFRADVEHPSQAVELSDEQLQALADAGLPVDGQPAAAVEPPKPAKPKPAAKKAAAKT